MRKDNYFFRFNKNVNMSLVSLSDLAISLFAFGETFVSFQLIA